MPYPTMRRWNTCIATRTESRTCFYFQAAFALSKVDTSGIVHSDLSLQAAIASHEQECQILLDYTCKIVKKGRGPRGSAIVSRKAGFVATISRDRANPVAAQPEVCPINTLTRHGLESAGWQTLPVFHLILFPHCQLLVWSTPPQPSRSLTLNNDRVRRDDHLRFLFTS
jgi:hypothetical protein